MKVPMALKMSRVLNLWSILSEIKDSPTAVTLMRRIRKHVDALRSDPSTGQIDGEKVEKANQDKATEYHIPMKASERDFVWKRLQASKAYTDPSFHDLERTQFWAGVLGFAKEPAFLDYLKKYGLDKADDDGEEDEPVAPALVKDEK